MGQSCSFRTLLFLLLLLLLLLPFHPPSEMQALDQLMPSPPTFSYLLQLLQCPPHIIYLCLFFSLCVLGLRVSAAQIPYSLHWPCYTFSTRRASPHLGWLSFFFFSFVDLLISSWLFGWRFLTALDNRSQNQPSLVTVLITWDNWSQCQPSCHLFNGMNNRSQNQPSLVTFLTAWDNRSQSQPSFISLLTSWDNQSQSQPSWYLFNSGGKLVLMPVLLKPFLQHKITSLNVNPPVNFLTAWDNQSQSQPSFITFPHSSSF